MNSHTTSKRAKTGRATITRTFTLYPDQDTKLLSAEKNRRTLDRRASASQILQELIDTSLDVNTGRAREYLNARDRAVDFEEDVLALLSSSGVRVERHAKILTPDGERTHRADFLVTGKKGRCIIELKSSAKRDRLELALGQALILGREAGLPVAVCVPVILDPGLTEAFKISRIELLEATDLVAWVHKTVG